MRILWFISLFITVFLMGWVTSNIYVTYSTMGNVESPFSFRYLFSANGPELLSPSDHLSENDIFVYDDRVVLRLADASWAKYADTNSMDPVFDEEANGIEVKPSAPDQIHAGDIISYYPEFTRGIVVHRVIGISKDKQGWYALVRGDNNPSADPEKVRFGQIHGVLAAIVY